MPRTSILITGATGFVGGRLLAATRDDLDVRVLVRDASGLDDPDGIDVVEGDLQDPDALEQALEGIDVAYYLVHSMEAGEDDFAERDRELAQTFIVAANTQSVGWIVYLGGIEPEDDSSEHLDSRREVEDILGSGVPELVVLRASMIVGAQSGSFRTLAQIVDRLPVLPLPAWRDTCTQPIGIDDVVQALRTAADVEPGAYDIAGSERLSIEDMCLRIAELQGHERTVIPLPGGLSKLEALAASGLSDADRELLEPLMEGLHHDLTVRENALEDVFGVTPSSFTQSAEAALREMSQPA